MTTVDIFYDLMTTVDIFYELITTVDIFYELITTVNIFGNNHMNEQKFMYDMYKRHLGNIAFISIVRTHTYMHA